MMTNALMMCVLCVEKLTNLTSAKHHDHHAQIVDHKHNTGGH